MKTQISIASLSLLGILFAMLAVAPAMAQQTLYDNGSYNGTTNAWDINFGYSVSDAARVSNELENITGVSMVYWDASTTDILTTVDMAIGSTSFGGTPQTLTGVTNTFLGTNQFGYNLYEASGTIVGEGCPRGVLCYLTLSNACSSTGGCSENPISWDENGGPSAAYESSVGSIPSEAFTLTGTMGGGTTPEPSSIMLFGSGILGVAVILRRRLMG